MSIERPRSEVRRSLYVRGTRVPEVFARGVAEAKGAREPRSRFARLRARRSACEVKTYWGSCNKSQLQHIFTYIYCLETRQCRARRIVPSISSVGGGATSRITMRKVAINNPPSPLSQLRALYTTPRWDLFYANRSTHLYVICFCTRSPLIGYITLGNVCKCVRMLAHNLLQDLKKYK